MILFYLLISVMPLTRHPLWGKFIGDLTVVKYLGVGCLLYAVFHMLQSGRRPAVLRSAQARWFVFLALWSSVSWILYGDKTRWRLSPFLSFVSFVLLLFLTKTLVDTLDRLRAALLVSIGSVALASAYVCREWQKFHAIVQGFRPGWVTGDPNYFSISALLCLPLAFCLAMESRAPLMRVFCGGSLAITFAALMMASSRGALLGLVTQMVFLAVRSRQPMRNCVILLLIATPAGLLLRAGSLHRLLDPSAGDLQSSELRLTLWKAGLRMTADSPLFGIGLGRFKGTVTRYGDLATEEAKVAHNSYVELAAEAGIPALIAFLGVLVCSFRSLERVGRAATRHDFRLLRVSALGLQAGLIAAAVALFFVSGQYQKLLWLTIFLSATMPALTVQRLQAAAAERKAAQPLEVQA